MDSPLTNKMGLKGFFEKYTDTYEKIMNPLVLDSYKKLLEYHENALKEKKKILESGAGNGHLTYELLKRGSEVNAIDINKKALKNLKEKSQSHKDKLKVMCIDAQKLPFKDESFEGVSSMLVLPFIENPIQYLKEHIRVLEKNGILVISGPDGKTSNIVPKLMSEIKRNLIKKPVWSSIKKTWKDFEDYTIENVDKNLKNKYSINEIGNILENLGMKIIDSRGNPHFDGTGYCIEAKKF